MMSDSCFSPFTPFEDSFGLALLGQFIHLNTALEALMSNMASMRPKFFQTTQESENSIAQSELINPKPYSVYGIFLSALKNKGLLESSSLKEGTRRPPMAEMGNLKSSFQNSTTLHSALQMKSAVNASLENTIFNQDPMKLRESKPPIQDKTGKFGATSNKPNYRHSDFMLHSNAWMTSRTDPLLPTISPEARLRTSVTYSNVRRSIAPVSEKIVKRLIEKDEYKKKKSWLSLSKRSSFCSSESTKSQPILEDLIFDNLSSQDGSTKCALRCQSLYVKSNDFAPSCSQGETSCLNLKDYTSSQSVGCSEFESDTPRSDMKQPTMNYGSSDLFNIDSYTLDKTPKLSQSLNRIETPDKLPHHTRKSFSSVSDFIYMPSFWFKPFHTRQILQNKIGSSIFGMPEQKILFSPTAHLSINNIGDENCGAQSESTQEVSLLKKSPSLDKRQNQASSPSNMLQNRNTVRSVKLVTKTTNEFSYEPKAVESKSVFAMADQTLDVKTTDAEMHCQQNRTSHHSREDTISVSSSNESKSGWTPSLEVIQNPNANSSPMLQSSVNTYYKFILHPEQKGLPVIVQIPQQTCCCCTRPVFHLRTNTAFDTIRNLWIDSAVNTIQRYWNGYRARQYYKKELAYRRWHTYVSAKARLIQFHVRCFLRQLRREEAYITYVIRVERHRASLIIQRAWQNRCRSSALEQEALVQVMMRTRAAAALCIQRVYRGFKARQYVDLKFSHWVIEWNYDLSNQIVEVLGNFTTPAWTKRLLMRWNPFLKLHAVVQPRMIGQHEFKFIVNGNYCCDGSLTVVSDGAGHYNNVVQIAPTLCHAPFQVIRERLNAIALLSLKGKKSHQNSKSHRPYVHTHFSPHKNYQHTQMKYLHHKSSPYEKVKTHNKKPWCRDRSKPLATSGFDEPHSLEEHPSHCSASRRKKKKVQLT